MNTLTTKHFVLDNGIITLKADKTHRSKSGEINELLVELGNYGKTLPFYAIYPADGSDPITFEGPITQSKVLAEFEKAGPSNQSPIDESKTASVELPWQPFTEDTLAQARAEGKSVMINFTADWDPNSMWTMKVAINRRKVLDLVNKGDVVPLLADWTNGSSTFTNRMRLLEIKSTPALAIYPAGKPDSDVIMLRELFTEEQVLDALKLARPSKTPPNEVATTASRD